MKSDENRWVDLSNGVAWAIIFSLAAIIMGVIALATRYPRTDLSLDYMGAIVGILSLLVTALIGWQIFNLIKIDRLKESLENAKSEMDKVKHNLSKDLHKQSAQSTMLHVIHFMDVFDLEHPNFANARLAYGLSVQSLYYQLLSNELSLIQTCISVMATCVRSADALGAWDDIFDNSTNEMTNGLYTVILPLLSILPQNQIEAITRIHDSRITKSFHQGLMPLTTRQSD